MAGEGGMLKLSGSPAGEREGPACAPTISLADSTASRRVGVVLKHSSMKTETHASSNERGCIDLHVFHARSNSEASTASRRTSASVNSRGRGEAESVEGDEPHASSSSSYASRRARNSSCHLGSG